MKSLPTWSKKLLRVICPDEFLEQIEGDLMEVYNHDVRSVGERKAKLRFIISTVRFLRPGILFRNRFSGRGNWIDLISYQVKFARRTFLREKLFSGLNVLGLALGISISILLLLILQAELTYDQHFREHDRIYRLSSHYQTPDGDEYAGSTARELSPILKEIYPEIESIVRIHRQSRRLVKTTGDRAGQAKAFYEEKVALTDSTYFHLFNHDFIAGDERTCLSDPNSVVITKAIAEKYFDQADVLDKSLLINDKAYKITGVIDYLPENSHLKFEFLISGLEEIRPTWEYTMKNGKPISLVFWNPDVYTYLLLPADYDVNHFYPRFQTIYDQYYKEIGDQSGSKVAPVLQSLANIHYSGFDDNESKGNYTYLIAFSGIALMIVLLACINYMNLATAKAINRATEVAVRKIVGSGRGEMVLSFLVESLALSFASMVIAIAFVAIVVNTPYFATLTGKQLTFDLFQNPTLAVGCVSMTLGIGLISGIYPAFYLPRIPTIAAMKGRYKNSVSSQRFRKILVTIQFCISIFVITCALFMRNQIDFVLKKDLGFNNENILVVPLYDPSFRKNLQSFKNDLLQNSNIGSVTASHSTMGMEIGGNVMFGEAAQGMQDRGGILALFVDDDYLKTMGIPLVLGRDFRPGEGVDEDGVYIANESAVKLMGWEGDPIGKKVTFWGGENPGKVIGVVKDFNAASLHHRVAPMFIVKGHWNTGVLQIRLTGEQLQQTIEFVGKLWAKYSTSHPFEYFFLDQKFNAQYREDIAQNDLLYVLSNICIFISLLGVFGISAFSVSQRTKEISVRKIMGAQISQIVILLSKDTVLLVVIAALGVFPICWWTIRSWMENFAYQHELDYLLYLMITFSAVGFVVLIILFQSLRTVNQNPMHSLRHE